MAARKKNKAADNEPILHGRQALLAAEEKAAKQKKKKDSIRKQMVAAFKMGYKTDRKLPFWVLGTLLGIIVLGVVASLVFNNWFFTFLGVFAALPISLMVMTRRIEAAAYQQIDGRLGATYSALSTIRRGWTIPEEPSGIDPKTQDMVWRGVGRGGVLLISEGPLPRVRRLVEAERKRVSRVLPDTVPVTVIMCGNGEGQVPLRKLVKAVRKVKNKLSKPETAEVFNRLQAIGGARLPIPKGIDPSRMRPDRKGLRGR